MDFYGRKNLWKLILLLFAVLIGVATIWYTESFLKELRQQEERRVEQFASALRFILNADEETNIVFAQEVNEANTTVPIILTDSKGNVMDARNVQPRLLENEDWVAEMKAAHPPIVVEFLGEQQFIYYKNSILLTKLRFYPIILLVVIGLFVIISYVAFSNARKSEQNQVWNGLAKETAHQIGTPLTSLVGWTEILRGRGVGEEIVGEMEKDVNRLNTITERFSKIGSKPSLKPQPIAELTREAVDYLARRSPRKINVSFSLEAGTEALIVNVNKPLYEWVIENLVRNAIDALDGKGRIEVRLSQTAKNVRIEVEDNGKGIAPNRQKAVFRPGHTSKKRGWGLGLSLAKRIIEEYHGGRIFVAQSEVGKGSTFRVVLRKS